MGIFNRNKNKNKNQDENHKYQREVREQESEYQEYQEADYQEQEAEYIFVPNEETAEEIDEKDMIETMTIEFTNPDGTVLKGEVVGLFTVAGENEYMAMHPFDAEDNRVILLPYREGADGNVEFRDFIDDEEYELAVEAFNEYFEDDFGEE